MTYLAKVLADSLHSTAASVRLTTLELTFPRFILAEFNTHRMLSRNAASSRAIPLIKVIEKVKSTPVIPRFMKNEKGMQSYEDLPETDKQEAIKEWYLARDKMVISAEMLGKLDVHKQFASRLLEPFSWTTVIASATDWDNFFSLRYHSAAQPEFKAIAYYARNAYENSTPTPLFGDVKDASAWHLPLVDKEEKEVYNIKTLKRIATGRCARVSYLTHEGKRDIFEDIKLHDRLSTERPGHFSPFEHIATSSPSPFTYTSNFRGFIQYRKEFMDENIRTFIKPVDFKL